MLQALSKVRHLVKCLNKIRHYAEKNVFKWSSGLKFIQLQKNQSHHTANNCIPYKTLFLAKPSLGFITSGIPKEHWQNLETAKQLYFLLGIEEKQPQQYNVDDADDVDGDTDKFDVEEISSMPDNQKILIDIIQKHFFQHNAVFCSGI